MLILSAPDPVGCSFRRRPNLSLGLEFARLGAKRTIRWPRAVSHAHVCSRSAARGARIIPMYVLRLRMASRRP
eukprot:scaffold1247_cov251-Pinguiococcus_pyrenoidosus.AAC.33